VSTLFIILDNEFTSELKSKCSAEKVENVKMAETELVIELEGLRKTGELKIIALEKQLAGLLKEAKSLRELLGMID
jgi:hypothetical protein